MKQKLPTLIIVLFISLPSFAQILVGQLDDFQDVSTENWTIGAAGTNFPVNIPDAGPGGTGDYCLQFTSTGGGGPESKMIILNNSQWTGDISGVARIKFDAKALTNDLELRIAFNDSDGNQICTTSSVFVTTADGWKSVVLNIESTAFTVVSGVGIAEDVLDSVLQMRILHNDAPSWVGDVVSSTLQIDNILAAAPLGINDNKIQNKFSINPNPGSTRLNLKLSRLDSDTTIEVFDVLGKKVYAEKLNSTSKSIDVFKWNSGVYLVRITSDNGTQTKRFVRQ